MDIEQVTKHLRRSKASLEKAVSNHIEVLATYQERLKKVSEDLAHVEQYGELPGCEGCKKNQQAD